MTPNKPPLTVHERFYIPSQEEDAFVTELSKEKKSKSKSKKSKKHSKKPTSPKPSSKFLKWIKWTIIIGIWGAFIVGLLAAYFAYDIPNINRLAIGERQAAITLNTQDNHNFATFGDVYGNVVTLQELPPYIPQAIMAIEDRRFYQHFGLDVIGLFRAMWANYRAGTVVQGGSTITQQLAKNFLLSEKLFDTYDRSLKRKIQELLLALWLEKQFTKDQILTIYLNRVYLGSGTFGIDAAAQKYFGKSARALNLYESAVIAGLLKAPSKYSPLNDPRLADQRAQIVLDTMESEGFISSGARKRATRIIDPNKGMQAPYFADWISQEIPNFLPSYKDQDVVVRTTLNQRLQTIAEWAIAAVMDDQGIKHKASQAAVVVMKKDGSIQAMVGGRSYRDSKFNRATQALRQPGSVFKLFVYLAALEAGYDLDMLFSDAPFKMGKWSPKNYLWKPRGQLTLREGLAYSVNTVSARIAYQLGPQVILDVARRLGLTNKFPADLSISLGTGEMTLLELTTAFAIIANKGLNLNPYGIEAIKNRQGKALYQFQQVDMQPIVDPTIVANLESMLTSVMEYGTGKSARLGVPAAGKTGTSQNYRDAWFVGYILGDDPLIVGVWMGNDNNSSMTKITGGSLPLKIWKTFMEGARDPNFVPPRTALPSTKDPLAVLIDDLETPATSVTVEDEPPGEADELDSLFSEIE